MDERQEAFGLRSPRDEICFYELLTIKHDDVTKSPHYSQILSYSKILQIISLMSQFNNNLKRSYADRILNL